MNALPDRETQDLTNRLHDIREEILRKTSEATRQIRVPMPPLEDWVIPLANKSVEWTETPSKNIRAMRCSLNAYSKLSTILNLHCGPGARIEPHTHDRIERIIVVEGVYTDIVSGRSYFPGDVQEIEAGTLHGLETEGALLTMIWQPPYEHEKVDTDR